MKWILIVVLIFVIMLIARAVSEQYKDKYDFYNNLKIFLNQFKVNVSFKQEKIINFLDKITPKKQFKLFVDEYKKYLNGGELCFKSIKILETDELKELENIVKSLGSLDVQNELGQLESFLLRIEDKLKKAEEEKNKLCPMILKLSLLFAIGLAIILI